MADMNTVKEFPGKSSGGTLAMHFTMCVGLAYGRLVYYGLRQICYTGKALTVASLTIKNSL